MYETVKIVNGYEIYKKKGTKGCYRIDIKVGETFRKYLTFSTLKAATIYCLAIS